MNALPTPVSSHESEAPERVHFLVNLDNPMPRRGILHVEPELATQTSNPTLGRQTAQSEADNKTAPHLKA